MKAHLFPNVRRCCCCDTEVPTLTGHRTLPPEAPTIVAISTTIYRKGKGKGILKAAGRVQICDTCFQAMLASDGIFQGAKSRRFLAALRERLAERYSAMLTEDAAS